MKTKGLFYEMSSAFWAVSMEALVEEIITVVFEKNELLIIQTNQKGWTLPKFSDCRDYDRSIKKIGSFNQIIHYGFPALDWDIDESV